MSDKNMPYVDVIVSIKVRLPYNGAGSNDEILNDLRIFDNDCYDAVEIRRMRLDCECVELEKAGYMKLLDKDGKPVSQVEPFSVTLNT